jgi:hypothetical protein
VTFVSLKLPPGMYRPGTLYDAKGRWFTGNLVRWYSRVLQAWGGWEPIRHTGGPVNLGEPVRGMHAWNRDSGAALLALGTPTKLWIHSVNALTDRTPVSFTTGTVDAAQTSGAFGAGAFGEGIFGVGDPAVDTLAEANSWQFDNWHEDLIALAYSDGKILLYDTSSGAAAAALTNAPTGCAGVVVTPENFVVALAPGGIARRVKWADVDDITDWTDLPDNFAGDLDISSAGRLVAGRATSRETLLWTNVDLWAMRYVGGEFVYGAQRIGASSLIGRRAMAVYDDKAVWMGDRTFYVYDGEVRPLSSEVADYVFNDINRTQASKIHAYTRAEFHEIVWHYPSAASTECDRYVVFNWEEGIFYTGELDRTAGVDSGVYTYPLAADSLGIVYHQEIRGGSRAGYNPLSTTFESHTTHPGGDSGVGLYAGGGGIGTRAAQTFSTDGGIVSSIAFYMSKVGTPPGNLTAYLYSTNGGEPLSIIATTANVAASTLSAHPTPGWVTFTFATPVVLHDGTYAVVVLYNDGDASNYVRVWHGSEDYEDGASWYYTSAWDDVLDSYHMFKVTGYGATLLTPYVESGPVEIGDGDRLMDITQYIPDQKTLGDSDLTIYGAMYPTAAERTYGPYTSANPTSVRINARQIRLRVDEVLKGWRFGTPRFDVQPGSRR